MQVLNFRLVLPINTVHLFGMLLLKHHNVVDKLLQLLIFGFQLSIEFSDGQGRHIVRDICLGGVAMMFGEYFAVALGVFVDFLPPGTVGSLGEDARLELFQRSGGQIDFIWIIFHGRLCLF